MNPEKTTLKKAKRMLSSYRLCNRCLGRQFPHVGIRNGPFGSVIRRAVRVKRRDERSCYLCSGLMVSLYSIGSKATNALDGYEYSTFTVGTSLSPLITEREDSLRAEFKLRGGETIKSEISREVSKFISRETGKSIHFRHPDISILIDPLLPSIEVKPRHLFVEGRYSKEMRGVSQKRERCRSCKGVGCPECNLEGYSREPSVQREVEDYLLSKFKAPKVTISWVGGEDPQSLVLGNGRPFFAEIQRPEVRHPIMRSKKLRHGIRVTAARVLERAPPPSPRFRLVVRAVVEGNGDFSPGKVKEMDDFFRKREVTMYSPNKKRFFNKTIYSVKAVEVASDHILLEIACDGGLNIKRFISGERGEISPSISDALGVECHARRDEPFDVLSVDVQHPRSQRSDTALQHEIPPPVGIEGIA